MNITSSANFATLDQVRNINHFNNNNGGWNRSTHHVQEENASYSFPYYALLGLDSKTGVRLSYNTIRTRNNQRSRHQWWSPTGQQAQAKVTNGAGFLIALSGKNDHISDPAILERTRKLSLAPSLVKLDTLDVIPGTDASWGERENILRGIWRVVVSITPTGHSSPIGITMSVPLAEKCFGLTFEEDGGKLKVKIANGQTFDVAAATQASLASKSTYRPAPVFTQITNVASQNAILLNYMKTNKGAKSAQALSGIQKTWKKIHVLAETVGDKHPKAYLAFRELVANASKSIDKVRVSKVFNQSFKDVTTEDQFLAVVKPFTASADFGSHRSFETGFREMALYKTDRKEKLKTQTKRAHTKLMRDLEFVNIDEDQYPLTFAAVSANKIPLGTFFSKKEQYFLSNDNWELWEKMLTRFPDVTIALANEVSRRKNYQKDLMS
jgi:hypothetical protein